MGLADLHIHTTHSPDGTSTVSAVLKHVAENTDLDLIAITDHDEIRGAYEALEKAPAYGVDVVPGSEISTAEGHLIALFIHKKVPAGLPLQETVLQVGEQGGLCIAAHPCGRPSNSLSQKAVRRALANPEVRRTLVGVETYNAGLVDMSSNRYARAMADLLPVAQVGSSDAHLLWMVGQGATHFPGRTAADLRHALGNRLTAAVAGEACSPVRLVRQYLYGYLLRRAGWVKGNAGPQDPIKFSRLRRSAA